MENRLNFKQYFNNQYEEIREKYQIDESSSDNINNPFYYMEIASLHNALLIYTNNLESLIRTFAVVEENCFQAIEINLKLVGAEAKAEENRERPDKLNKITGKFYFQLVQYRLAFIYKLNIFTNQNDLRTEQYTYILRELKQAEKLNGIKDDLHTHMIYIEAYKELSLYQKGIIKCQKAMEYILKQDKTKKQTEADLAKIYSELSLLCSEKILSDNNILSQDVLGNYIAFAIDSFCKALNTSFYNVHEILYIKLSELLVKFKIINLGIKQLENMLNEKYIYKNEEKCNLFRFYKARLHLENSDVLNFFIETSYVTQAFYIHRSEKNSDGISVSNYFMDYYNNLGEKLSRQNQRSKTHNQIPKFALIVLHFKNLKRDILQFEKRFVKGTSFQEFLDKKIDNFVITANQALELFGNQFIFDEENTINLKTYLNNMAIKRADEKITVDNDLSGYYSSEEIEINSYSNNVIFAKANDSTDNYCPNKYKSDDKFSYAKPQIIKSKFFSNELNNSSFESQVSEAEVNELADLFNQSFDNQGSDDFLNQSNDSFTIK